MKILLIEDHELLARATVCALRELHHHQVEHVSTAAQAKEITASQPFDLLLIDLNLPDMKGFELAAQLRQHANLDQTIFVALTGEDNVVGDERLKTSGIDACFTKPMDFELLDRLRRRA
ncbi:MAG TPA: response regulator [Pirellulales bacterium]|nr:response regulator [Pirellulales bacterium]